MLAVSAPTSSNKIDGRDHHHHHHHLHRGGMEIEISSNGTANDIIMDVIDASNCNTSFTLDDFPEFSVGGGNLLDSIDFDDLFTGISDEGDEMLPGLETDPHELLLSEFSVPEDDSFSNYESMPSFKVEVEDKQQQQQQQQQQVVIGDEGRRYYEEGNNSSNSSINYDENNLDVMMNYSVSENENGKNDNNNNLDVSGSGSDNKVVESKGDVVTGKDEEIESKKMEELPVSSSTSRRRESSDKAAWKKWSSKSSSNNNNNKDQGKRKTKVDWTPDLHRRFVQAVEQLGVDKAVPSRILELMGIDCLTRHNIASHLQKYRSHRKHLLAREAEAARWTQKRQIYNGAPPPPAIVPVPPPPPVVSGGKVTAGSNHHVYHHHHNPWNSPTMGFPPPLTRPTMHHNHHHPPPPFLPLHVWGHPTHHMEAANGNHRHHQQQPAMMPIWPKHIVAAPPPPHGAVPWAKHLTPPPTVAWHSHPQRVPNALPPCFPQPPSATHHSFGAVQPVPGVPPPPHPIMYSNKPDPAPAANPPNLDFHPTKESIDAAIGDVISKPWLPLPLGLKPPSVDSVLVELQRQGIPKIPPSSSTTST